MHSSMIRPLTTLTVEERGPVPIQDFVFLDYGSLQIAESVECKGSRYLTVVEGGAFGGNPLEIVASLIVFDIC